MIVVDKAKLRFLLAGRTLEVDVTREYRRGRSYALGTSNTRSVCRVQVLERVELEDGSWKLTIRQSADAPRLLAARPGPGRDYVSDPHLAMRDEPEAVDSTTLDRFAAEGLAGHARRKEVELRRQHVRSATIRLREAERREDWPAYRLALQDLQNVERAA